MDLPLYPVTEKTESGPEDILWATEHGYEGAVMFLLKRPEIDPNAADTKCDRTPLLRAVEHGYEEVVGLLLEGEDIDPNI